MLNMTRDPQLSRSSLSKIGKHAYRTTPQLPPQGRARSPPLLTTFPFWIIPARIRPARDSGRRNRCGSTLRAPPRADRWRPTMRPVAPLWAPAGGWRPTGRLHRSGGVGPDPCHPSEPLARLGGPSRSPCRACTLRAILGALYSLLGENRLDRLYGTHLSPTLSTSMPPLATPLSAVQSPPAVRPI